MAAFQFILCALVGVIGINGKPPSPVVGGSEARDGEFPYQVAFNILGKFTCGGSIIDTRHILTAAHCIDEIPDDLLAIMTVHTGSNNIFSDNVTVYDVKSWKKHPLYAPNQTWKNDIAIVTLDKEIKFDERLRAIELPTQDAPGDVMAVATGWGDTSHPNGTMPAILKKLEMRVIPKGACRLPKNAPVHDGQLCAIYKLGHGLCTGDSGGPLAYDGKIIGIASFVYRCGLGVADIFTRVYEYVDWIKQVTSES